MSSAPVGVVSSVGHALRVDRRPLQQPHGGRRRHGELAVRARHRAAADVERRRDDAVGAEPFHREHGADDVDDRVDGADLVQVDAVERHVVNRGLGFGEPVEQRDGARLPGRRQRRTADVALDVGEAVMTLGLPAVALGAKAAARGSGS